MQKIQNSFSNFWSFCCDYYQQPGVKPRLLRAQDMQGMDVLVALLWLYECTDGRIFQKKTGWWQVYCLWRYGLIWPARWGRRRLAGVKRTMLKLELQLEKIGCYLLWKNRVTIEQPVTSIDLAVPERLVSARKWLEQYMTAEDADFLLLGLPTLDQTGIQVE